MTSDDFAEELLSRLVELHRDTSERLARRHPKDRRSQQILRTRRNAIQHCISELMQLRRELSGPVERVKYGGRTYEIRV